MKTNDRLIGDELQRRLWNAGFAVCSTGGGFYAYAKVLEDGNAVMICDNDNQIDDVTDDDFIVALRHHDGAPLAEFVKSGGTLEYFDYGKGSVVTLRENGASIMGVLIAFGVTI